VVKGTAAQALAMKRGARGGPAVLERGPQLCSPAVNPAAHRAQLDAQGGGDLLVGEPLDVAEHHGRAVLRRQCLQRGLDIVVEVTVIAGQPRRDRTDLA